jgi:hypothetical protein
LASFQSHIDVLDILSISCTRSGSLFRPN